MALPDFSMRQLLEAGVHFGHQTHRWNPKMGTYIYGDRNGIHIIDLAQTVPLLHQALVAVRDVVAAGGRVLFVATKRQASDIVAESARRCAQYYVNHRWLGGTLTNWKTISHSIRRLRQLEDMLAQEHLGLTKKETLNLTRERDKLERALGGIKDMGGIPDLMFVIDTNKEAIAIQEARKLNIPVVAIVDTNCDPQGITYPIPGNDDAGRAISLYCDLIARAALEGISVGQGAAGVDIGELENPLSEPALEDKAEADTAEDADLGFPRLSEPRGAPDDLKKITGLGPTVEKKLNELGIYHFWQIAEMNTDQIRALDDALQFKGRVERDDWAAQAKGLAGLDA
ncbi:30S ribosomal protein S2 [Rhodoligotrophos defluvii]|uniref:30S ribosomal protein S2 n=1 Tax=Rhodoligotrophos defluvii TaxID=2561934 RepID=UPI0010C9DE0E|nr:30S ribosomal protein S2 [Rhodoligotrophos defluvii]